MTEADHRDRASIPINRELATRREPARAENSLIVPSSGGGKTPREGLVDARGSRGALRRNTSYIRGGLRESARECRERIEIYRFIGNHLNAGGLFYEVTAKERLRSRKAVTLRVSALAGTVVPSEEEEGEGRRGGGRVSYYGNYRRSGARKSKFAATSERSRGDARVESALLAFIAS